MSISSVTSEALQAKLRQLLPSQQGFGTDLSASDTIIPVIDLTEAAEGSSVPSYLTNAIAYGSQSVFDIQGATTTIINTTGFYRVFGIAQFIAVGSAGGSDCVFIMNDGATDKIIWGFDTQSSTSGEICIQFDYNVFMRAGDILQGKADANHALIGSTRQIADINGTLTQPVGFTPS